MVLQLLEKMVETQRKKLVRVANRVLPNLTWEDLLQPQDYPELENHAEFRYEEGILDGLRVAKTALLASWQEGVLQIKEKIEDLHEKS